VSGPGKTGLHEQRRASALHLVTRGPGKKKRVRSRRSHIELRQGPKRSKGGGKRTRARLKRGALNTEDRIYGRGSLNKVPPKRGQLTTTSIFQEPENACKNRGRGPFDIKVFSTVEKEETEENPSIRWNKKNTKAELS